MVALLRLASEGPLLWTWLKENCFQVLSAGWEVEWECSSVQRMVELHKLGFQGEETRWRNALKLPEDKECGGTGDTVAQYYSYYHFQYIFIYMPFLRLVRWNSFWFQK